MNKALIFAGLVAVALIPLAQSVDPWPRRTASVEVPAAASAVPSGQDSAATAIDDLAAWPAAAGR